VPFADKVALCQQIDAAARARDPRVSQVSVGLSASWRDRDRPPDGFVATDVRPLVRLGVQIVASRTDGAKDRVLRARRALSLRTIVRSRDLEPRDRRGAGPGADQSRSVAAPAGEMPVVLGPGWCGVLLHEAVGHGLEGDFNRKGTSAFSGRIGEPGRGTGRHRRRRRGDREAPRLADHRRRGHADPAQRSDRGRHSQGLSAGSAERPADGGRADRQRPPRKLCPRADAAHDQHLHARRQGRSGRARRTGEGRDLRKSFGGGQVDITSGKFVFSCTEAYRIENGKLAEPVKGATLIGDGPTVLTRVRGIGNDMALDEGIGVCGKGGQSVPAGVGQPTLLIEGLTVGGTAAA
jgi:TldD protein